MTALAVLASSAQFTADGGAFWAAAQFANGTQRFAFGAGAFAVPVDYDDPPPAVSFTPYNEASYGAGTQQYDPLFFVPINDNLGVAVYDYIRDQGTVDEVTGGGGARSFNQRRHHLWVAVPVTPTSVGAPVQLYYYEQVIHSERSSGADPYVVTVSDNYQFGFPVGRIAVKDGTHLRFVGPVGDDIFNLDMTTVDHAGRSVDNGLVGAVVRRDDLVWLVFAGAVLLVEASGVRTSFAWSVLGAVRIGSASLIGDGHLLWTAWVDGGWALQELSGGVVSSYVLPTGDFAVADVDIALPTGVGNDAEVLVADFRHSIYGGFLTFARYHSWTTPAGGGGNPDQHGLQEGSTWQFTPSVGVTKFRDWSVLLSSTHLGSSVA